MTTNQQNVAKNPNKKEFRKVFRQHPQQDLALSETFNWKKFIHSEILYLHPRGDPGELKQ